MKNVKKYSLSQSISLAFSGFLRTLKSERNIKIHLSVAPLVLLLGVLVNLSRIEWLIIILLVFVIFAAETFNSAIEEICNLLRKKLSLDYEETKLIRDVSAGAVLLLAIASVIIGLIIFTPRLF